MWGMEIRSNIDKYFNVVLKPTGSLTQYFASHLDRWWHPSVYLILQSLRIGPIQWPSGYLALAPIDARFAEVLSAGQVSQKLVIGF